MPEARINLAQATIHLATRARSRTRWSTAIDEALADVQGRAGRLRAAAAARRALPGRGQARPRAALPLPARRAPKGSWPSNIRPTNWSAVTTIGPSERGDERQLGERLARLRAVIRGETRLALTR